MLRILAALLATPMLIGSALVATAPAPQADDVAAPAPSGTCTSTETSSFPAVPPAP